MAVGLGVLRLPPEAFWAMTPREFERFRVPLHAASLLEIAGPVQNVDGVVHVRVRELAPLAPRDVLPDSHDYC